MPKSQIGAVREIRTPTVQTIFPFLEDMKVFVKEIKYSMGTSFAETLGNGIFDAPNAEKNEKLLFCVVRRIWPFGPAKAKSSRRVLRTTL